MYRNGRNWIGEDVRRSTGSERRRTGATRLQDLGEVMKTSASERRKSMKALNNVVHTGEGEAVDERKLAKANRKPAKGKLRRENRARPKVKKAARKRLAVVARARARV